MGGGGYIVTARFFRQCTHNVIGVCVIFMETCIFNLLLHIAVLCSKLCYLKEEAT
jgi:hypothetical protein